MASLPRLLFVWVALLLLLATTIGATFLPLGSLLPWISYAIAATKAGLVLWFFMELRVEGGLVRLAAAAGFAWLAFLLIMLAADFGTRGWIGG